MFGKKQQIKTVISILLITVFIQKSKAQDNTLDFLKDYYCVGAFGQFTVDRAGKVYNDDGVTPNFTLESFIVPQYGIIISVFQHKNWNFKTGFILKHKIENTIIFFQRNR